MDHRTELRTEPWRLFQEVSSITNNLARLLPLGTLYFTNIPISLSKAAVAPDGWSWVDLPYGDNPALISLDHVESSLSAIVINLRYLADRAHIKMTHKIIGPDLVCVRVYVVPYDIEGLKYLNEYRALYRRGKQLSWHEKNYKKIMMNLLMVLDYDPGSWLAHLKGKELILFSCLTTRYTSFDSKIIGSDFLGTPNYQIFNFHVKRFIGKESFKDFKHQLLERDLESKLLNLYNSVKSPSFDLNSSNINEEQKQLILDILNNEIDGLKSELYPYQKQSVAKMLEKEFYPQIMTSFIKKDHFYLDITTLRFHLTPEIFITPRGGILLENMGLGKTLICLSLICCSKNEISQIPHDYKLQQKPKSTFGTKVPKLMQLCIRKLNEESVVWKPYQQHLSQSCLKLLEENPGSFVIPLSEDPSRRKSNRISSQVEIVDDNNVKDRTRYLCNTTIVITPDNLFHQWLLEIKKHLKEGFLKILKLNDYNSNIPDSKELIKYDLVMISNSVFAKQAEVPDSPLKYIYWKRLIIDEGHSMNSKISRVVFMIKNLSVERKWAISGTPTAGLTRLHMNEEVEDDMDVVTDLNRKVKKKNYVVKRKFDVNQDLNKLGVIISSFFQMDPWHKDFKLWNKQIVKPFTQELFGSDLQLQKILTSLLVRHELKDIEDDISLPPLHHKTVFLTPSFHDKISLNLFTAVLLTNAVTSERTDQDYMFHPSNRSELRRLVTNLQKLTFYWTGFTINDIETLISICENAKKKKHANGDPYYKAADANLLDSSILWAKMALSNERWRTLSAIHEMNYFIKDLPTPFIRTLSTGVVNSEISTYGAPQLGAVQAFFYKNRFTSDIFKLGMKLDEYTKPFWKNYWKDTEKKNIQRVKNRDGQVIDAFSVSEALAPAIVFNGVKNDAKKRKANETWTGEAYEIPQTPKRKLMKTSTVKIDKTSPRQLMQSSNGGIKTANGGLINSEKDITLIRNIRKLKILGSLSLKLSYLASRLLEHQLSGVKSIVFFEFEESAYYLTELLDLVGVNYLMYATFIKLNQRLENLSKFSTHSKSGITLIMDLKLAAHGLTIISATRVYFINPVWKKSLEAQAIKRAHRIGQTNEVYVETVILKDTIEEEMFKKRLDDDKKPEKDVEASTLIDDTGMQEFVLRHIFLSMDKDNGDDEIRKFEAPATSDEPCLGTVLENLEETDNAAGSLLEAVGMKMAHMRIWDVPLFSNANMLKQNEHFQVKRLVKLDGDGEISDFEVDLERAPGSTRSLTQRLRRERLSKSVRFT